MRSSRVEALGLLALLFVAKNGPVFAQGALAPISPTPQLLTGLRELQLLVLVNGERTGLFESFVFDPQTSRLAARRRDLTEAGVKTPNGAPEERINLDSLPGAYRYDAATQTIDFILNDEQRLPRVYDASQAPERPKPQAGRGAIVNYSLFGGSVRDLASGRTTFNNANVMLDARAFSEWGILTQTGLVGAPYFNQTTPDNNQRFQRYDTSYVYADPDSAVTYKLGDAMSGGTAWSRPIRMGGAQVARDFSLRSDIVTRPMPSIAGSAAAPSTVDVLVNGVRAYSQNVAAGPYSITNLPLIAAGGNAQVVVRDSSGRVVEQSLSLFNPARMLAPGVSDFSLDGGWARRGFGSFSDDYDRRPIASGVYRRGLNDLVTFEGHAEGGAGLANGGAGAIARLGPFGTLNLAGAGSHSAYGTGAQAYGEWQTQFRRFSFSFGMQRTFGNYDDLASVTARIAQQPTYNQVPQPDAWNVPQLNRFNARAPRELDRAAVSFPLFDDRASMSLGVVNLVQKDGTTSRLFTASLSRSFAWFPATLFANAYADRGDKKSLGASIGLNFPLMDGLQGSVSGNGSRDSRSALTAEIAKPQRLVDDTSGFRLRGGYGPNTFGQADASYRSAYGQVSGSAIQTRNSTQATAQLEGSVAVMGGGVFVGNKVDTAFAVVDAGAPGVSVMQDHRFVGKTNFMGKMLVPNLRPWERNVLGIDPEGQPVDYDASKVVEVIAPRGNSGVVVNFGGHANVVSAIVVFVGPDGKPLQPGFKGHLAGKDETFLVGHDGRAYVRDLANENVAVIDLLDRECRARFGFTPTPGRQGIVRGVVCQ